MKGNNELGEGLPMSNDAFYGDLTSLSKLSISLHKAVHLASVRMQVSWAVRG